MTGESTVIEVIVYGAKQLCATCLHLPSSEETGDWLKSALSRDYGDKVSVRYIDVAAVDKPFHDKYVHGILADDYAYPLVVIDGEVVGEGNPRLQVIRHKLEEMGLKKLKGT